jgi:hypothetical protein
VGGGGWKERSGDQGWGWCGSGSRASAARICPSTAFSSPTAALPATASTSKSSATTIPCRVRPPISACNCISHFSHRGLHVISMWGFVGFCSVFRLADANSWMLVSGTFLSSFRVSCTCVGSRGALWSLAKQLSSCRFSTLFLPLLP